MKTIKAISKHAGVIFVYAIGMTVLLLQFRSLIA